MDIRTEITLWLSLIIPRKLRNCTKIRRWPHPSNPHNHIPRDIVQSELLRASQNITQNESIVR